MSNMGQIQNKQASKNDGLGVRPDEQIQRLKDQVEFRNRFFRMVIHDLRGPATSIQMGSEQALQSVKKMLRTNLKQNSKVMGAFPQELRVMRDHNGKRKRRPCARRKSVNNQAYMENLRLQQNCGPHFKKLNKVQGSSLQKAQLAKQPSLNLNKQSAILRSNKNRSHSINRDFGSSKSLSKSSDSISSADFRSQKFFGNNFPKDDKARVIDNGLISRRSCQLSR